jgi:hypothetical protein
VKKALDLELRNRGSELNAATSICVTLSVLQPLPESVVSPIQEKDRDITFKSF